MDDDIPLASLSLTHVFYDPSDPISYLCAWLALVPQALCIVYVTLIWCTREAEVLLLFAGQLACEAANFALKRLIKEERPSRIHRTGGKGYGMPSSHAQFVAFWAVAMTLFLLRRHRPRLATTTTTTTSSSRVERGVLSAGIVLLAAAVAWSRVYLNYHTVKQVLVGALAGAVCAGAWYAVTAGLRETGLLAWALETRLARALRVRDLVVREDLPQAGWEKWEAERAEVAARKGK